MIQASDRGDGWRRASAVPILFRQLLGPCFFDQPSRYVGDVHARRVGHCCSPARSGPHVRKCVGIGCMLFVSRAHRRCMEAKSSWSANQAWVDQAKQLRIEQSGFHPRQDAPQIAGLEVQSVQSALQPTRALTNCLSTFLPEFSASCVPRFAPSFRLFFCVLAS